MRDPDPIAAADPSPADACAPARALTARQMARLERLAEIGMEIAEAAGRLAEALAQGGAAGDPDPGLLYTRAARAVRLTIALQARLAKDLAELDKAETVARSAQAATRRARVQRGVEEAIEAGDHDVDEFRRLSSDAWERLTDEDEGELLRLPLAELVARICADLGLPPDWGGEMFDEPDDAEAAFTDFDFAGETPMPAGTVPDHPAACARASPA
jgi:hypothetical protein